MLLMSESHIAARWLGIQWFQAFAILPNGLVRRVDKCESINFLKIKEKSEEKAVQEEIHPALQGEPL